MRKKALIGAALLVSGLFLRPTDGAGQPPELSDASMIALAAICSADAGAGKDYQGDLTLSGGMGTGGFAVDSDKPEAQTWFDYGLALSHAFYHQDAKVAMRRASEADPECARCAFGEAYVLGPTLNYGIGEADRKAALAAAERALALAKPGDDLVRRLAEASIARYRPSAASTEPAFGRTMLAIANDYPDNLEIAVLASHALLIPIRRGDASGLAPALDTLERVLARNPGDTGAIHYYIHATEFAGRAGDALPYARRLGELAPLASHLVHMPAHTFFRVGLYHEAAVVNARAMSADVEWWEKGGDSVVNAPGYYAHNLAFGLAGALMSGDGPLALKYAEHAPRAWKTAADRGASYAIPRTWVALALYAPEQALAVPEQAPGSRQAIYRAYARGEAYVALGDLSGARAELAALAPARGARDVSPEQKIAHGVLSARIAMAEGDARRAARLFAAAARVQETELAGSWDPPLWWYPVRRSVAAAWLKAGNARRAEREAQASLNAWANDPMALQVLSKALARQGKADEAARARSEALRLWKGDPKDLVLARA